MPPMSCTIELEDDIDISRGMMLVHSHDMPHVNQELDAMLCWMADTPLEPRKKYVLKHTTNSVRAMVRGISYKVDIQTMEEIDSAGTLELNEIGSVKIRIQAPIIYDDYRKNRATGAFILIDESTNATVAAGMLRELSPQEEGGYII